MGLLYTLKTCFVSMPKVEANITLQVDMVHMKCQTVSEKFNASCRHNLNVLKQ